MADDTISISSYSKIFFQLSNTFQSKVILKIIIKGASSSLSESDKNFKMKSCNIILFDIIHWYIFILKNYFIPLFLRITHFKILTNTIKCKQSVTFQFVK